MKKIKKPSPAQTKAKAPIKAAPKPTPKDWLAWVVLSPDGFPILDTVADRRGHAIETPHPGGVGVSWEDQRRAGYRVVRIRILRL